MTDSGQRPVITQAHKNRDLVRVAPRAGDRRTVGQIPQKCKETSNLM